MYICIRRSDEVKNYAKILCATLDWTNDDGVTIKSKLIYSPIIVLNVYIKAEKCGQTNISKCPKLLF